MEEQGRDLYGVDLRDGGLTSDFKGSYPPIVGVNSKIIGTSIVGGKKMKKSNHSSKKMKTKTGKSKTGKMKMKNKNKTKINKMKMKNKSKVNNTNKKMKSKMKTKTHSGHK